jgi:hypothetical protein
MTITEAQPQSDGGSSSFVATYATSGSMLTLTGVSACGSNGTKSAQYTASDADSSMPATITIYDQGSERVSTFTIQ